MQYMVILILVTASLCATLVIHLEAKIAEKTAKGLVLWGEFGAG